jgi:hypothetical protein
VRADRILAESVRVLKLPYRETQSHKRACDRCGARPAIRLYDVTVDPDLPLTQFSQFNGCPQRTADSSTLAVQITRVRPTSINTDPSA